jgi:hypothetical protein
VKYKLGVKKFPSFGYLYDPPGSFTSPQGVRKIRSSLIFRLSCGHGVSPFSIEDFWSSDFHAIEVQFCGGTVFQPWREPDIAAGGHVDLPHV